MDWKTYRHHEPRHDAGRFPSEADDPIFEYLVHQGPGRRFNYVPGKIVVPAADVSRVQAALGDEGFRFEKEYGSMRLYSGPASEPGALVGVIERVRGQDSDIRVAPLHALAIQDHGDFGPAGPPTAAPPLPLARLQTLVPGAVPGEGVKVGVLDTGAKLDHPMLRGHLAEGSESEIIEFDPETGHLKRAVGHGTHVSSVVLRCAPGATIFARRVITTDGVTNDCEVLESLREVGPEVDILCLPWGGFAFRDDGLPGILGALDDLYAEYPDLVIVAAAGNDSRSDPFWPAADDRVIGVGALDENGERAGYSNYGPWVDTYALGTRVHGAFVDWEQEHPTNPVTGTGSHASLDEDRRQLVEEQSRHVTENQGPWATWSGTSFATPTVAGAIAAAMRPGDGSSKSARDAAFEVVRDGRLPRPAAAGSHAKHKYII